MMRKLPPLIPLRAFEAAARNESFSKAANELCVSQSAISQNVRQLEERLNVKLFIRSGNNVKLTEKGKAYQLKISESFNIIAEATDNLTKQEKSHQLHIAVEPAIASCWLRPRLSKFRAAHPFITLHIITKNNISSFSHQGVDIAIHNKWDESLADLYLKEFVKLSAFPACNSKRLKNSKSIIKPNDLRRFHLIHDENIGLWQKWLQTNGMTDFSFDSDLHFDDFSLAVDAAIDGEGVILADEILCETELLNGQLTKLFDQPVDCDPFYIISTNDNMKKTAVTTFHDWLLQQLVSN